MKIPILIPAITFVALLSACGSDTHRTDQSAHVYNYPSLPIGWTSVDSADAVVCWMKPIFRDGRNDTDYVIIADLKAGASVRPLDSIASSGLPSPVFHSYSLTDTNGISYWTLFKIAQTFAMANLMFFDFITDTTSTAQVCYPIYYEGHFISRGCTSGFCGRDQGYAKRMIVISDTGISVMDCIDSVTLSKQLSTSVLAAFVGNQPVLLTGREPDNPVARTYLAKQGRNLIIYSTLYATQKEAYRVIRKDFQVDSMDIVMFDGGGSTEMICKGKPYIHSNTNRLVPSAIEICSAR